MKVTLTIPQSPDPLEEQQVLDLINPGQTKAVSFRDLDPISFGSKTVVTVNVLPVAGERNRNNNTAEYTVFFALPS